MSGLDAASGVAGLIALALAVTNTITEYATAVKDKSKNIKELRDELELLGEILSKLKDFLAAEAAKGRSVGDHSVLRKAIRDCTARIERIGDALKPPEGGKIGRAWDRFTWPFEQRTVLEMIQNLRRFTHIFEFALTIEGCNMMSKASDEATASLKDMLGKLNGLSTSMAELGVPLDSISEKIGRVEEIMLVIPVLEQTAHEVRELSYGIRLAEQREMMRTKTEILDWLCPISALQKHQDVQERRTPGTGQWFLRHRAFETWMEDESAPHEFLCYGGVGVGKTVLSSFVVDHLSHLHKEAKVAIVFYYFDYAQQQAQTPVQFASCLLRQLCRACHAIPTPVAEFYERTRDDLKDQGWFQELQHLLQRVIALFDRSFFIIDAFDEAESGQKRDGIFHVLDVVRAAKRATKIFATTRPQLSDIEQKFRDAAKIQVSADREDLKLHLGSIIDHSKAARAFMDDELRAEILRQVGDNADGIFLLAALQIGDLLNHVTKAGVRKALKRLSEKAGDVPAKKLNEVFDATIARIRHQDTELREVALKTLMWVAHAKRPLTAAELQHALAVQFEDSEPDEDNIVPLATIIDSCCGLVEVEPLNAIVKFRHFALQEYLEAQHGALYGHGDLEITRICLKYISFACMLSLAYKNRSGFAKALTRYRFLEYASVNWGFHAQGIPVETYQDLAIPILSSGRHLLVTARVRDRNSPDFRKWRERMDAWAFSGGAGISLAASFGLTDLVRLLITQTPQQVLTARNMYGSTPLHETAMLGYIDTAELLISSGANLLDTNMGGNTPIYLAVGTRQLQMVETLVKYDRDQLHTSCRAGLTPLHKATDLGDVDMVALLLRHGAKVEALDDKKMTPLHFAARRGSVQCVELLVRAGAAVHVVAEDHLTPLDHAATGGHVDCVRFLLDHGGLIHHKAEQSWSPIHRAARGGHTDTVRLLLQRGADVLAPDKKQAIPLFLAVRSGSLPTVEVLLAHSPALERRQLFHHDRRGSTPRVVAFFTAQPAVAKYLRTLEQSYHPPDPTPTNQLFAAIEDGNDDEVRRLLAQASASLETPDADGQPPLHFAIQENQPSIVTLLLSCGASIESRGYHGWRPLHIASALGNLELVRVCLTQSPPASIHATTDTLQTPLHKACSSRNPSVVRELLEAGADPEAKNDRGMTALHVASHQNDLEITRLLVLEHHVDVFVRDHYKDTAKDWALRSGHFEMAAFLRTAERSAKLLELNARTLIRSRVADVAVAEVPGQAVDEEDEGDDIFDQAGEAILE